MTGLRRALARWRNARALARNNAWAVRREGIELGRTRKGVFIQPEIGLPPGFVLPSAALTPPDTGNNDWSR